MKQFMLFVAIVVAVATPSFVQAQETETISFVNQIGCEISYKIVDLADIIATSVTLDDDDEAIRLLYQFEEEFPSELGPDELAVEIMLPDDDYFNVIFLQETEDCDSSDSYGGWLVGLSCWTRRRRVAWFGGHDWFHPASGWSQQIRFLFNTKFSRCFTARVFLFDLIFKINIILS